MSDIRLVITGTDEEKLEYVKDFLKIKKNTDLFRLLLDNKYEELKKLRIREGRG